MSNNKRTNNSIYNNVIGDEDEVGNKEEQQTEYKRYKRISKEQLDQLWPLYSTLRPSYESDREIANIIAAIDDYSMFSPYQILTKIKNTKSALKRKGISNSTITTTTTTTNSNIDYKDADDDYVDDDSVDDDSVDDYTDDDYADDDYDPDSTGNNDAGSKFHYFKIWSEESNEELLKLYKESRHLYSTDRDFVRKIMQDKSFTRDEYSFEQILRQLCAFRNKLNIKITNAPRQPPPIPSDRLELWELFKSLRPNYTTDKDTIIKLMNDNEKYNKSKYSLSQIASIISHLKPRLDTPSSKVIDNAASNNSLAIVPYQHLIQQEDKEEYQDKEKNERVQIKEIKSKLKMYENENKELKSKVGTLENKVSNLNQIIKENKEPKLSTNSSYLNGDTEIASTNSATIIKLPTSKDDYFQHIQVVVQH